MTPNPYKSPIQLHILSTRHPHSFAESGFSKEGSRMNLPNKYPHHPSEQVPPNSCEIRAPSDLHPQTPIPDTSHKTPSKEIRCPPHPTLTHARVPAGPPVRQNPSPISKFPGTTPHTRRPRFGSPRPGGPPRPSRKKVPSSPSASAASRRPHLWGDSGDS